MSTNQGQAIQVKDPAATATQIVNGILVGQGMLIESPLGEKLGLWRHDAATFEVTYRGSEIRGSATLAIAALAKFMDHEGRRSEAMRTIAEAVVGLVDSTSRGFAQAPAVNDNKYRN